MSSQFTNNYTTAPTSPNLYISRKLNNMEEVQAMKKEWNDWTRLYQKTLKGIEMMIDMQKMVKNMKKIAEVANITCHKLYSACISTTSGLIFTN